MNDKEQTIMFISTYMDLLRILKAEDRDKDIQKQLTEAKAKLQVLGVVVEELTIS